MAGYGLTQAAQLGLNAYYTADDRTRRAEQDQENQRRYDAGLIRQERDDEERKLARDQSTNYQTQQQMMNTQDWETKRAEDQKKMANEGIYEAAIALKNNMPDQANSGFNATGSILGEFKPNGKGGWNLHKEDGTVRPFDPDKTIAYYSQLTNKAQKDSDYQTATDKPIYDSRTGKWITPPNPATYGGGEGGGKPTETERKIRESIARGTPRKLAEAEAYGYTQKVQDPTNLSTKWIDLRSNEPIGELSIDGKWSLNPKYSDDAPQSQVVQPPQSGYKALWEPGQEQGQGQAGAAAPQSQGLKPQSLPPQRPVLRTREAIATEKARNSPAGLAQQVQSDIAATPVRMNQQTRGMAGNFGLTGTANRGQEYTAMAQAMTRVEKDLRQLTLPDENDLIEALQFAVGSGDQAKADEYQRILQENFGAK